MVHRVDEIGAGKGMEPMKYFVLLAAQGGDRGPWEELSPVEQESDMAKHGEFAEACAEREGVELIGGEALGEGRTATTLRTKDGELVITDGPFAEAAEQIGGYYVVEAPNLDTVIDLCRTLPPYDIEIRPILDLG